MSSFFGNDNAPKGAARFLGPVAAIAVTTYVGAATIEGVKEIVNVGINAGAAISAQFAPKQPTPVRAPATTSPSSQPT